MAALKLSNIPDDLYRRLRTRAKLHGRSLRQEIIAILRAAVGTEKHRTYSILELQGLGKEVWKGIDAAKYIDDERRSWD